MSPRVLMPYPGFPTGIGYYLSGMEEVREQLCKAVKEVPDEAIGRRAFPGAHSIGALVLHIGESEWWWMQHILLGQELTEQVRQAPYWDVLEDPEGFGRKGFTTEFCLQEIEKMRNQTREVLSSRSDDDLERITPFERRGEKYEYSLRWMLHHLIDHEAQHKGQILMLKRLMMSE